MRRKTSLLFSLFLFGAAVGSCTPIVSQHGNMLKPYQMEQIEAGKSTRSDVLRSLGSPTTQSAFDSDIWYYIGQTSEKYGILDPKVTEEKILVVTFDKRGIVKTVAPFEGAREEVPYAKSKTPTHGNDLTVMQQLLGNLGRFNGGETSATDY